MDKNNSLNQRAAATVAASVFTLASPIMPALFTGCSFGPQQPEFSSLVTRGASGSPGLKLDTIPGRLATLGAVHRPVYEALVATITFGETADLGDLKKVNEQSPSVRTLSQVLRDTQRALSNAQNSRDLLTIKPKIVETKSAIGELAESISTREKMEIFWNMNRLNEWDELKGSSTAIRAQEKMQKMVEALDEDIASLVPGYELSRVISFSRYLGGAQTILGDVKTALAAPSLNQDELGVLNGKLAQSIQEINQATSDPSLTKLASGTPRLLTAMTALHTGLMKGASANEIKELQGKAETALEQLKILDQSTSSELKERNYSGGGRQFCVLSPCLSLV